MTISADIVVDRLFSELNAVRGTIARNPVTDGEFVWGLDPIKSQKQAARRALTAREWFEKNGPADAQPLPLSHSEREDLKRGGVLHILAWYARSLEALDYDVKRHPSFYDFACGVMASPEIYYLISDDPVLRRRFPPRHLVGLGPGLYWDPPPKARAKRKTA